MMTSEFLIFLNVSSAHYLPVVHKDIAKRTCSGGYVLGEIDVALLAVLNDTAVVHVVALVADTTGGNAAGRHDETVGGVGVAAVLAYAVGTLQVVGGETAVGRLVERLVTDDDAVVDTKDIGGLAFEGALLLLGRQPHVVGEVQVGGAAADGLADLTEDAA